MKDKNNKPDNQLKHDDNYILLNKSELNEIIKEAITQLKQLEDKPLTNYSNVMLLIIGIIYTFLYLYLTILLGFMVYEHYSFADIVTILCSDGVIILLGYAVFKKII